MLHLTKSCWRWLAASVVGAVVAALLLFGAVEAALEQSPLCHRGVDEAASETAEGQPHFCYRGHTAEEWIGILTAVLAGFTWALAMATAALWLDTRTHGAKQARMAHRQFLAAQKATAQALTLNKPPKLRAVEPKLEFVAGAPLKGRVLMINDGGTNAKIEQGSWLIVRCLEYLPQMHPIHDLPEPYPNKFPDMELASGRSQVWTFEEDCFLTLEDVDGIASGSKKLYIMGLIRYVDTIGNLHTTKFTRCYDTSQRRYLPVDDPDYSSRA